MVGGKVINIIKEPTRVWVQCIDADQLCAIFVKDAKEMKVGDALWWQGNSAYWTPKPDDGREDIELDKIGYSHSSIPKETWDRLFDRG